MSSSFPFGPEFGGSGSGGGSGPIGTLALSQAYFIDANAGGTGARGAIGNPFPTYAAARAQAVTDTTVNPVFCIMSDLTESMELLVGSTIWVNGVTLSAASGSPIFSCNTSMTSPVFIYGSGNFNPNGGANSTVFLLDVAGGAANAVVDGDFNILQVGAASIFDNSNSTSGECSMRAKYITSSSTAAAFVNSERLTVEFTRATHSGSGSFFQSCSDLVVRIADEIVGTASGSIFSGCANVRSYGRLYRNVVGNAATMILNSATHYHNGDIQADGQPGSSSTGNYLINGGSNITLEGSIRREGTVSGGPNTSSMIEAVATITFVNAYLYGGTSSPALVNNCTTITARNTTFEANQAYSGNTPCVGLQDQNTRIANCVFISDGTSGPFSSNGTPPYLVRGFGVNHQVGGIGPTFVSGSTAFLDYRGGIGIFSSLTSSATTGTTINGCLNIKKGADVASSGTISVAGASYFLVTGTTTIDKLNQSTGAAIGARVILQFADALQLTHLSGGGVGTTGDLYLNGRTNYTTVAGDTIEFVYDGTLWRELPIRT